MTLKLPKEARQDGIQISFVQLQHGGTNEDDWLVDNLRVGGRLVNPDTMMSNFTDGIHPAEWNTFDNMEVADYCQWSDVAIGDSTKTESATLTTQDLDVKEGHMMQFWYNIGCLRPWNTSVAPIHLQYSTDYGMTWSYITPQCLSHDPRCPNGDTMASVYYGDPMGRWQRVILSLESMTNSKYVVFLPSSFYKFLLLLNFIVSIFLILPQILHLHSVVLKIDNLAAGLPDSDGSSALLQMMKRSQHSESRTCILDQLV